jgi:hypothetical protein
MESIGDGNITQRTVSEYIGRLASSVASKVRCRQGAMSFRSGLEGVRQF